MGGYLNPPYNQLPPVALADTDTIAGINNRLHTLEISYQPNISAARGPSLWDDLDDDGVGGRTLNAAGFARFETRMLNTGATRGYVPPATFTMPAQSSVANALAAQIVKKGSYDLDFGNATIVYNDTFAGPFLISGPGEIANMTIIQPNQRTTYPTGTGNYLGQMPGSARACGITVYNTDSVTLRNIKIPESNDATPRGFSIGIILAGKADGSRAQRNKIIGGRLAGNDMGIIGWGQTDYELDGIRFGLSTNINGRPPHPIYFTDTGGGCGVGTARNCYAEGSGPNLSGLYKFRTHDHLRLINMAGRSATTLIATITSKYVEIENPSLYDQWDVGSPDKHMIIAILGNCVIINGHKLWTRDGERVGAVQASGCGRIEIGNGAVYQKRDTSAAASYAPYLFDDQTTDDDASGTPVVVGTTNAIVRECLYVNNGTDSTIAPYRSVNSNGGVTYGNEHYGTQQYSTHSGTSSGWRHVIDPLLMRSGLSSLNAFSSGGSATDNLATFTRPYSGSVGSLRNFPANTLLGGTKGFATNLGGVANNAGGGVELNGLGQWRRMDEGGYETVATDADSSVAYLLNGSNIRHTATLTANRTLTVDTSLMPVGEPYSVFRTGGGSFTLTVTDGTVTKTLAQNQSAYFLRSAGGLVTIPPPV